MPYHKQTGKILREGDQLVFKTRFMEGSAELTIPVEEIFEDFEGESIEIYIEKKYNDPPQYEGHLPDWTTVPEKEAEEGFPFCSAEGRERFLDMKVGLMVHFGLYTHLGLLESWSAYGTRALKPFQDVYYTLYQVFNPSEFDAEEWARVVKRAGFKFIQITTKHHEGFCLWDTDTRTRALRRIGSQAGVMVEPIEECEIAFSVRDTPFKRDIIKELADAFHRNGLGFGLYFSHIDWNDPNFRWDPGNRSYDPHYSKDTHPEEWNQFIKRERDQLRELFTRYGRIDQLFFDGTWWDLAWDEMKEIVRELRVLQPHCMINDRGIGPYGDFTSPERFIPKGEEDNDPRVKHKLWQVCDPIGTHWGYVPDEQYKPVDQLILNLIDVVAKGGTIVFDQGPMPNGRFPPEAISVLEKIGDWLSVNGEAIYCTRKWKVYKQEPNIYFTRSKDSRFLYAIHWGWPVHSVRIENVSPLEGASITMLGIEKKCLTFPWVKKGDDLIIEIPQKAHSYVPCKYAYTFKIPLSNADTP